MFDALYEIWPLYYVMMSFFAFILPQAMYYGALNEGYVEPGWRDKLEAFGHGALFALFWPLAMVAVPLLIGGVALYIPVADWHDAHERRRLEEEERKRRQALEFHGGYRDPVKVRVEATADEPDADVHARPILRYMSSTPVQP